MRYPALIDFDGDRLIADFPDCPGCQATVDPSGDVIAAAGTALHRWLESCFVDGTLPPRPSVAVVSRDWFEWIDVEPTLARRLLLRWAVAKRISRAELARRTGLSEDTVASLEDERVAPTKELLDGIARALGVFGGPARTKSPDERRRRPPTAARGTPAAAANAKKRGTRGRRAR